MKMRHMECCYLVTVGLVVVALTSVDGEEEDGTNYTQTNTFDCWLRRVCQSCTCHINGRLEQTFCPDPEVVLQSVHIIGGNLGCSTVNLNSGLLSSFRTKYLKLQFLGIRTLHNHTFREQEFVEELSLRNNLIETIENGSFLHVPRLQSLDLTSNRLRHFPFSALHVLTNLTNLYLAHNRLTRLEPPTAAGRLLPVHGRMRSGVGGEPGQFPPPHSSSSSSHRENEHQLEQLEEQLVQQQHEQQEAISSRGINSLELLNLSYNRIDRISVDFINMFPKLSMLTLQRNRLVCDCGLAWLRDFQKCMCAVAYSRCRSPRGLMRYTVVTFPVDQCSTSRTSTNSLTNCVAPRNCVYNARKPALSRARESSSGRPSAAVVLGTWGSSWGNFINTKSSTATTATTLKTGTISSAAAMNSAQDFETTSPNLKTVLVSATSGEDNVTASVLVTLLAVVMSGAPRRLFCDLAALYRRFPDPMHLQKTTFDFN